MDDCYVGDDGYVRMLVLLATSMVMMMVPVMVTIGNGSEAYCSCEEDADRDTMVVGLMVRKKMMEVLMVIHIVMIMMDAVTMPGDVGDEDVDVDGGLKRYGDDDVCAYDAVVCFDANVDDWNGVRS